MEKICSVKKTTECPNIKFPVPTLQFAGYSVKHIITKIYRQKNEIINVYIYTFS